MSDLYTSMNISPRKRRCPPEYDDEITHTPKRLRTAPPTPPATVSRKTALATPSNSLPIHLMRMYSLHTAVQHAISHALATCAVSPSSDTGIVRNVLNHFSLATYSGLTTKFDLVALCRLCWLWEWDGKELPVASAKPQAKADEDNPFDDGPKHVSESKEWSRGAMGIVLSPATHYSKTAKKRVPAYGVGIEVEMNLDKNMGGGMAAVARWTAESEPRRKAILKKLERWVELHTDAAPVPQIPPADLPPLAVAPRASTLTRALASASPKGMAALSYPVPPSSPSRSPSKTPSKRTGALREFAIPFPLTPSKSTLAFPQTPSRRLRADPADSLLTPRTPSSTRFSSDDDPSTPTHQRGTNAATAPDTPSTSRRQALYDRVRLRSLTASPTKSASSEVKGGSLSKQQLAKLGQEEIRRRCLLGRLGGVAESVWMLFSTPSGSSAGLTTRKRRALPKAEVATSIMKSSPVPISSAEAQESLTILADLCPFFLKPLNISGQEWLEMPAPVAPVAAVEDFSSPSGSKVAPASPCHVRTMSRSPASPGHVPPSPGRLPPPSPGRLRGKDESAVELMTRSPRRVKREAGGLREVREIIRRELEMQD